MQIGDATGAFLMRHMARVKRGGSWAYSADYCTSSVRDYGNPSSVSSLDGAGRAATK